MDVPNLDCLPPDTLLEEVREQQRRRAAEPDMDPAEYVLSRLVETYAQVKFLAMELRANGRIIPAVAAEKACECLYRALPREHRW